MKCRPITYEYNPPGGWPYVQEEGIRRTFPSQPMIESQAHIVAGFRKANGLPRPTFLETLEDIGAQNCRRLGCDRKYCRPFEVETGSPQVALGETSPMVKPCGSCGAPVQ